MKARILRSFSLTSAIVWPGVILLAMAVTAGAASVWRPIADARNLNAVWMASSTVGVAVGDSGLVRRTIDGGATWTYEAAGTTRSLRDVWGTDANHIWAVGDSGTIIFWNGTKWAPQTSGTFANLRAISGVSSTNILAVGTVGTVQRWNGSTWSRVSVSGVFDNLNGVFMLASNNAWIVGDNGRVQRWNGSVVSNSASGTTTNLRSVWAADATHVWAVGASGLIRFWNGTSWSTQTSGTTNVLTDVRGSDSTHVWALSASGEILATTDGSTWTTAHALVVPRTLAGLWVVSATQAFAVGDRGTVVLWDGATWTASIAPTPAVSLNSVWGVEDGDLWVVGDGGTIMHWDGATWTFPPSGTSENLHRVWGLDASNVYAVGDNGTLLKWNGATWSAMAVGTIDHITGIWGTATNRLWVCTLGNSVFEYNGATWAQVLTAGTNLHSIWGLDNFYVYAVGDSGSLYDSFGNAWRQEDPTAVENYYGVWGVDEQDIWVVGENGTIKRNYEATLGIWTNFSSPASSTLLGIAGVNKDRIWAVGGSSIVYYNGIGWFDDVPANNVGQATNVWPTSVNAVFVTTADGVVYTNSPATVGEIAIEQPVGTALATGSTLNFGSVDAPASATNTFNIKSLGVNPLTGLVITKSGAGAADYTVTAVPATLASGASVTFDVTFLPTATGTRNAVLTIVSNDADESPFTVNLTGVGRLGPTITTQPLPKTVNPNAAASFSVVVKGTTPFSYQWQRYDSLGMTWNNVGTNSPTFSIAHVAEADEADYRVVITNVVTSTTSNVVTLTVNNPVVIDPPLIAPLAKHAGDPVTFTVNVNASSTLPVTFQWTKNNANIAGATSATYSIPAVAVSQGGDYRCVVKNIVGSVTAGPARLTVVDGAAKTLILPVLGTATITASVSGTDTASTFLWHQNNPGLLPADSRYVPNKSTLTIKALTLGDAGLYDCDVTGLGGMVTSGTTTLIVYDSKPELPIGTVTPLVMPDAIVGGNYLPVYSIKAQLDPAANKTPSAYSATGLPPGLKCNTVTGEISGKPAVILTTPTKTYPVTLVASNAKGKLSIPATLLLHRLPDNLAGTYAGYIDRQTGLNKDQGGRFDLTVQGTGAFTGKVTLGATPALSFNGSVNTSIGGTTATGTATIVRKAPLTNLTITFTIDTTTNSLSAGSVTDTAAVPNTANIAAWRNKWNATASASAYVGYHNFIFDDPSPVDPAVPQGNGYGSFTISNAITAAVTAAGKLADGVTYSTASFVGPNGEVLIFAATAGVDSIVGKLMMTAGTLPQNSDSTIGGVGAVTWRREDNPVNTNTRVYEDGFGLASPVSLSAKGGRYIGPVTPNILFGVTDDGSTNNARLVFSEAELGVIAQNPLPTPDTNLRLSKVAVAHFAAPPRPVTLTANAATGLFSGRFTLVDPNPLGGANISRATDYFGMVINDSGTLRGYGFFLLAKRPAVIGQTVANTEQLSGQVVFEKFP